MDRDRGRAAVEHRGVRSRSRAVAPRRALERSRVVVLLRRVERHRSSSLGPLDPGIQRSVAARPDRRVLGPAQDLRAVRLPALPADRPELLRRIGRRLPPLGVQAGPPGRGGARGHRRGLVLHILERRDDAAVDELHASRRVALRDLVGAGPGCPSWRRVRCGLPAGGRDLVERGTGRGLRGRRGVRDRKGAVATVVGLPARRGRSGFRGICSAIRRSGRPRRSRMPCTGEWA